MEIGYLNYPFKKFRKIRDFRFTKILKDLRGPENWIPLESLSKYVTHCYIVKELLEISLKLRFGFLRRIFWCFGKIHNFDHFICDSSKFYLKITDLGKSKNHYQKKNQDLDASGILKRIKKNPDTGTTKFFIKIIIKSEIWIPNGKIENNWKVYKN